MDIASNLELSKILIGASVIVLNVLDSVTTSIGLGQDKDKDLRAEGNPFMRFLMVKNKLLAELLKQGVILGVVIIAVVRGEVQGLRVLGILLGLVVLNNSFLVIARAITKKKVKSPFRLLQKLIHLPDKFIYLLMSVVFVGLAYLINFLIWR